MARAVVPFKFILLKRTIIPLIRFYMGEVEGFENLPKEGGFIVASNHGSYMDHLILSTVIVPHYDQKLHFLAKKEHFDSLYQRVWHKYVGAIPLDRESGGEASLDIGVEYLKKGKIMGIYPEGTRTLDGKLQRGKTGVARLALRAKVPVLPVGLIGTFDMLPKGKTIPKLSKAKVKIGKLMSFDKYYGKENDRDVLRRITNEIMKEVGGLVGQDYGFD